MHARGGGGGGGRGRLSIQFLKSIIFAEKKSGKNTNIPRRPLVFLFEYLGSFW